MQQCAPHRTLQLIIVSNIAHMITIQCRIVSHLTNRTHASRRPSIANPTSPCEDSDSSKDTHERSGRPLIAEIGKEEIWTEDTQRLWGYRGMRVGEASHPGPENEDNEEVYDKHSKDKSIWPGIRTQNRRIHGRMKDGVATVDLPNSSTQHAYTT